MSVQLDHTEGMNGPGALEGPLCAADLDGDGSVRTGDLLGLLAQWGTTPGGPPDFDGNGVGTSDLLVVLAAWGECSVSEPPPDGCPSEASCFEAHTEPGCNDLFCCLTVCSQDPFCCDLEWDQECVETAVTLCQE